MGGSLSILRLSISKKCGAEYLKGNVKGDEIYIVLCLAPLKLR